VSSYVGRWRRAWVVALGGNLAVQVLSSIDGSGSSCDALQSLTLCVLAGVCVFIAYARPHRALLASYLVCASLVLTMVTALLGLLCRHGAVSEDAVSGFGVFASVAMFVFKALNGALFIGEKKLLRRNNISYNNENDDSEMKTRPTRDSTVSPSVISARQTPNRHRGQHPAQRQPQFAEVIATDVKVQQRETRQSKITVEQVERLQKLIEMACGVLASNRIPTAHHR
ncbi:membrane-associated protein, putative, partial [Bodo saltans]